MYISQRTERRTSSLGEYLQSTANEVLVRLRTNDGIQGFGLATSYTNAEPILEVFRSGIAERLIGACPLAPERIYEDLFSLTARRLAHEKGWGREALVRISAAVDVACWDIIGKWRACPFTSCLAVIATRCLTT